MADPAYYESRSVTTQIHQNEHRFTLYLREGDGEAKQILRGAPASNFGSMGVSFDWAIYDGLGNDAKLVARAQGQRSGVLNYFSLAFIDERFRNSSIIVHGEIGDEEGKCAIVGGTGEFVHAQGEFVFKNIKTTTVVSGSWATKELHVLALCPAMTDPQPPQVEHTIIDSPFGSTVATSTDLIISGQGDKDSGSPIGTTPISKNKHQAEIKEIDTPQSSTRNKRHSTDTPVDEHANKRLKNRKSFAK